MATATATPTAAPVATVGPLVISPNPDNFGLTSVLGSSQTSTVSQSHYSGPFTLPANPVICGGGLFNVPVTATLTGSTLTVTLGILGATGSCVVTVDGAPGTSGTLVVNLTVPLASPPVTGGPLTFSPDPVVFNVLNAVVSGSATATISETGYTGAFALPANAISCPFNLLPLTKLTASITGNVITLDTGLLNANLLGTCNVTVDDANGNSGQLAVNFQLL